MDIDDPNRVGIEIRRVDGQNWRDVVSRYAHSRNLTAPAVIMFDKLVNEGISEPWAALRALDIHGCTDLIVDKQHLDFAKIRRTLT